MNNKVANATKCDIMAENKYSERDRLLAETYDLIQRLSAKDLFEIMEGITDVL